MKNELYDRPGGEVIQIDEIRTNSRDGVLEQHIREQKEIIINRLQLPAKTALPARNISSDRFYVVLSGTITISGGDKTSHKLSEESLFALPRGVEPGERVTSTSVSASLLEVQRLNPDGESIIPRQSEWLDGEVLVVPKSAIKSYEPEKHANTTNHTLFLNDHLEILISCIDVGGGSDEHLHPTQEQFTYVRNPEPSKLLYYPQGVVHGGQNNMPARHDLVVIFSPPYYKVV